MDIKFNVYDYNRTWYHDICVMMADSFVDQLSNIYVYLLLANRVSLEETLWFAWGDYDPPRATGKHIPWLCFIITTLYLQIECVVRVYDLLRSIMI